MDESVEVAVREAIALDARELRHRAERLEDFAVAAMQVIRSLGGLRVVDKLPHAETFYRAYGKVLVNRDVDPSRLHGEA